MLVSAHYQGSSSFHLQNLLPWLPTQHQHDAEFPERRCCTQSLLLKSAEAFDIPLNQLTNTSSAHPEPHRHPASSLECQRNLTNADNEETPVPKPDTKALAQQSLPVLMSQTCHHHAKHHQYRSNACQRASVASIKQWSRDHKRHQNEEPLHRSNPRQLALCRFAEGARSSVVSLIHAVAV